MPSSLSATDLDGQIAELSSTLANDLSRHDVASELASLHMRRGRVVDAKEILLRHAIDDRVCGDALREYLIGERENEAAGRLIASRPRTASASAWVDVAIRKHWVRDFDGAIGACQQALSLEPGYAPAYNHKGRAFYNMGRSDDAKKCFESALGLAPDYVQVQANLAHVLRGEGDVSGAEYWFSEAVARAPGLRSAQVGLGTALFARGEVDRAASCFERALKDAPADAQANFHLGLCAHAQRDFTRARRAYESALASDPGNVPAMRHLGLLSEEQLLTDEAVSWFRKALALMPEDVTTWADLVATLEQSNQLQAAEDVLRTASGHCPGAHALRLESARLMRRRGHIAEALAVIESVSGSQLDPKRCQLLQFEKGILLDRLDRPREAFEAFVAGNAIAAASPRARGLNRDNFLDQINAVSGWVGQGAPFPDVDDDEDQGEDICFLFGFARSGTTLLDVMLSAQSSVRSLEERPTIEYVWSYLGQMDRGYPGALPRLDRQGRDQARAIYRAALRQHGIEPLPGQLILDKMPMRTPHAALIHRLFPKAKLVFAARHPADVVLSNFMQNYALSEIYCHFFTISDAARSYRKVMALWRQTVEQLQLPHHVVRYESLLAEPGSALGALCAFLGLAFDPIMTDHRRTLDSRERIRTNSYHQVAEPLNTRALARWERYREQLAPVLPDLADAARGLGYDLPV